MSVVVIAKSQEDLQVQEATSNKSHFNHLNHKSANARKQLQINTSFALNLSTF